QSCQRVSGSGRDPFYDFVNPAPQGAACVHAAIVIRLCAAGRLDGAGVKGCPRKLELTIEREQLGVIFEWAHVHNVSPHNWATKKPPRRFVKRGWRLNLTQCGNRAG